MKKAENKVSKKTDATTIQQEQDTIKKNSAADNSEPLKWYFITCHSGKEQSTAKVLQQSIKANDLEDHVDHIVVPTQEKIVMFRGKKKKVEERILPGYILAHFSALDRVLHLIRNTEGVTGFVGMSTVSKKPKALDEKQAQAILAYTKVKQEPVFETKFTPGMAVKVIHGPFTDFVGKIDSINENKGRVQVILSLFGNDTNVDLDILEIAYVSE